MSTKIGMAIIFGGAGFLLFFGALTNADWLFDMRRSKLWLAIFGRGCSRIIFMLIGLACMASTISVTLSNAEL